MADFDWARIGQVVTNLVDNAIKYTPEGGTIRVRVRAHGGDAVVEVEDTGRGLAQEQAAHLFQPFTQVHVDAPYRGGAGTGLGLYISRGVVEAHGGRIWVRSDGPSRGSTFAFSITRRPVEGAGRTLRRTAP